MENQYIRYEIVEEEVQLQEGETKLVKSAKGVREVTLEEKDNIETNVLINQVREGLTPASKLKLEMDNLEIEIERMQQIRNEKVDAYDLIFDQYDERIDILDQLGNYGQEILKDLGIAEDEEEEDEK